MGWPQITYIALTCLGLGITAAKHGESRGKHNFFASAVASALVLALLWAGGFFS